jgi:hypothetical protein
MEGFRSPWSGRCHAMVLRASEPDPRLIQHPGSWYVPWYLEMGLCSWYTFHGRCYSGSTNSGWRAVGCSKLGGGGNPSTAGRLEWGPGFGLRLSQFGPGVRTNTIFKAQMCRPRSGSMAVLQYSQLQSGHATRWTPRSSYKTRSVSIAAEYLLSASILCTPEPFESSFTKRLFFAAFAASLQ